MNDDLKANARHIPKPQVIALAARKHALPTIPAPGRGGHTRASAAAAAQMDLSEEQRAMRGPLAPPCDGEPTLLIVVRDPELALALGEKAAAEGIKV